MLSNINDNQAVRPRDLNKIIQVINQLNNVTGCDPIQVTRNQGGIQITSNNEGFLGVITERNGAYTYKVKEVTATTAGGWTHTPGGNIVGAATEWNNKKVDIDQIVWVEKYKEQDWRFEHCCGEDSSSSSSSSSGSSQSGGCLTFYTGMTFDAETCTVTMTTATACFPDCVTLIIL